MSTSPEQRKLPEPIVGTAAASGSPSPDSSDQSPDDPRTWIEIVLKDNQGNPVAHERYRVKLPDGSMREGSLDGDGKARVDGIKPGSAQVSFPDRDGDEWKPG